VLCSLPLWGTSPTENQRLEHVQQKVAERQAELQALYTKHNLDENWAIKQLEAEELTEYEASLANARTELQRLEAKINLIKIKQTHGLDLALSGMLIVFLGLAAISGFIALLPILLSLRERRSPMVSAPPAAVAERASTSELDPETLTAIALVLHAEHERASGQNLKVTLGLNPSPWALSSQMRVLPGRIQS
jgi:hypothetical protein